MTKLEELIKELCSSEVELYNLYTLFDNFSGMTAVTNKWVDLTFFLFYWGCKKRTPGNIAPADNGRNTEMKRIGHDRLTKTSNL